MPETTPPTLEAQVADLRAQLAAFQAAPRSVSVHQAQPIRDLATVIVAQTSGHMEDDKVRAARRRLAAFAHRCDGRHEDRDSKAPPCPYGDPDGFEEEVAKGRKANKGGA